MNWRDVDWAALERMRAAFLEGSAGRQDYWLSESDLRSYDATYAQRIGWKWDYVLNELQLRGWMPPGGVLLDWGCGSGVASRAFLHWFGAESVNRVHYWDRSPLAMRFAANRARTQFPHLEVVNSSMTKAATVILSHVLTELDSSQVETLLDSVAEAASILWVEPGAHDASTRLIGIRERLREQFSVIAPCTHQTRCGLLADGNERHWCHHFATPPAAVFTDTNWGKFAHFANIDLRSLPLSFLVLDKRPPPAIPPNAARVIGRPRVYKPHALLLACNETGVHERRLSKRTSPDDYRRAKKQELEVLQLLDCEEAEIKSARPAFHP